MRNVYPPVSSDRSISLHTAAGLTCRIVYMLGKNMTLAFAWSAKDWHVEGDSECGDITSQFNEQGDSRHLEMAQLMIFIWSSWGVWSMDTQQVCEPHLLARSAEWGASDLGAPVQTGELVTTFSFHQQQARHHSEGPGDRPVPRPSSEENSTSWSYPGTCPMKLKKKPLAAEKTSQSNWYRFIIIKCMK